ncbi:MAG: alpha/beta hydrolase [Candidatus Heimdallarchaeota archaeon]|nr:alpha/beta hydrolase [Candidatus Heimdallarchaeota archaeon]
MDEIKMTSKSLNSNSKLMFFIFLIPLIIFGELLRVLHRVGPYKLKQNYLQMHQGFIRTRDRKKIAVKYTDDFDVCVILIHGYLSSSKRSIWKYQELLPKNGYDIIAVDFRNHGLSSLSLPISAGYYEKNDIMSVIRWSKNKWSKTYIIASSLGAYAAGYALADLNDQELPDAALLESFGVDIKIGTRNTLMSIYKFPKMLASAITIYAHLRTPIMFERNVINDLSEVQSKIPIMIAHGQSDVIYPPNIIQTIMRKRLSSDVKFLLISKFGHSELWQDDKFKHAILDFFK